MILVKNMQKEGDETYSPEDVITVQTHSQHISKYFLPSIPPVNRNFIEKRIVCNRPKKIIILFPATSKKKYAK